MRNNESSMHKMQKMSQNNDNDQCWILQNTRENYVYNENAMHQSMQNQCNYYDKMKIMIT